jgi:hypothetical protein
MSEKKKRDVFFVTLSSTRIEVTGFNGLGMHEEMVTNVLGAVEIIVASISTISTMKQLQRRGSEC